jgi:putative membrane protein insertion efficiency factor
VTDPTEPAAALEPGDDLPADAVPGGAVPGGAAAGEPRRVRRVRRALRDRLDWVDGCTPDLSDLAGCLPDPDGCSDGCGDGCDGCGSGCDLNLMLIAAATVAAAGRVTSPPGARPGTGLLIRLVVAYRTHVSPRRAPCCRYTPTCSTYALTALQTHGPLRGTRLTLARLRRCRPGGGRGVDPVPTA